MHVRGLRIFLAFTFGLLLTVPQVSLAQGGQQRPGESTVPTIDSQVRRNAAGTLTFDIEDGATSFYVHAVPGATGLADPCVDGQGVNCPEEAKTDLQNAATGTVPVPHVADQTGAVLNNGNRSQTVADSVALTMPLMFMAAGFSHPTVQATMTGALTAAQQEQNLMLQQHIFQLIRADVAEGGVAAYERFRECVRKYTTANPPKSQYAAMTLCVPGANTDVTNPPAGDSNDNRADVEKFADNPAHPKHPLNTSAVSGVGSLSSVDENEILLSHVLFVPLLAGIERSTTIPAGDKPAKKAALEKYRTEEFVPIVGDFGWKIDPAKSQVNGTVQYEEMAIKPSDDLRPPKITYKIFVEYYLSFMKLLKKRCDYYMKDNSNNVNLTNWQPIKTVKAYVCDVSGCSDKDVGGSDYFWHPRPNAQNAGQRFTAEDFKANQLGAFAINGANGELLFRLFLLYIENTDKGNGTQICEMLNVTQDTQPLHPKQLKLEELMSVIVSGGSAQEDAMKKLAQLPAFVKKTLMLAGLYSNLYWYRSVQVVTLFVDKHFHPEGYGGRMYARKMMELLKGLNGFKDIVDGDAIPRLYEEYNLFWTQVQEDVAKYEVDKSASGSAIQDSAREKASGESPE